MGRLCVCCGSVYGGGGHSHAQWMKGRGKSKCKACVQDRMTVEKPPSSSPPVPARTNNTKKKENSKTPPPRKYRDELRTYITCDRKETKATYSFHQWSKGAGVSKCNNACMKPKPTKSAFIGFFEEGSVGCQLFQMDGGIRSYLSVEDLVKCSTSGIPSLKELCRTYFAPDLVENKGQFLATQALRIELRTKVMQSVTTYSIGKPEKSLNFWLTHVSSFEGSASKPKANSQRSLGNTYKAYIYHPDELDQVHAIVDRYLRRYGVERTADSPAPLLVLAHYCSNFGRKKTVTRKVAAMIKDDELVLSSPRKYARYWYNDWFGDIFPAKTKYLEILTQSKNKYLEILSQSKKTGVTRVHIFREDTRVALAIRNS
mmetsp:Transcript_4130/g.8335  ORF Transcript_4130/g.8335 Transcript_4130/m.8335 type:complete len:372 (-) Transcript_4130:79-1194(-)